MPIPLQGTNCLHQANEQLISFHSLCRSHGMCLEVHQTLLHVSFKLNHITL